MKNKDVVYVYICQICNHEAFTKKSPKNCLSCGSEEEYLDIDEIELE